MINTSSTRNTIAPIGQKDARLKRLSDVWTDPNRMPGSSLSLVNMNEDAATPTTPANGSQAAAPAPAAASPDAPAPAADQPPRNRQDMQQAGYSFLEHTTPNPAESGRLEEIEADRAESQAKAENLGRIGLIGQGVSAVLETIMLATRRGPTNVGVRQGLDLTAEAKTRLDAEDLVFQQKIKDYYDDLKAYHKEKQDVDRVNTAIQNQVVAADYTNRITELTSALREAQSLAREGDKDKYNEMLQHYGIANSLIRGGDPNSGLEYLRQHGLLDDDGKLSVTPRSRATASASAGGRGAGRVIDTPEGEYVVTRADMVAYQDYRKLAEEYAELQRQKAEARQAGTYVRGDELDLDIKELEERMAKYEENPYVKEQHAEQRYWSEIKLPELRRRLGTVDDPNVNATNPWSNPDFVDAVTEIYEYLSGQGFNEDEIRTALRNMRVPGFYKSRFQIMNENMGEWRDTLQQAMSQGDEATEGALNGIRQQIIQSGLSREDAEYVVRSIYETLQLDQEPAQ